MHWAPQLPSSCAAIATRSPSSPSYSSLRALATLLITAAPPVRPVDLVFQSAYAAHQLASLPLQLPLSDCPRECAPCLRWPLYPEMAVPRRAKSDNCCLRAANTRSAPPEMKRLFLKHRGTRVHPIREWDRQPSKWWKWSHWLGARTIVFETAVFKLRWLLATLSWCVPAVPCYLAEAVALAAPLQS